MLGTTRAALMTRYVAVGTGTTPTRRDSGAVTATQEGNAVTASAGFFTAEDVGRLLKFDSGSEVKVTSYTDAQHVTVSGPVAVVAASEFTVWYVNQTGLITETTRLSTLSTGAGECGSSIVGDTLTMRRTLISGVLSAGVTLREIGWSPSGAGNLFGRALIPGGGDSVGAGQMYKVQVEMSVKVSPAVPHAVPNVGAGCNTAGQAAFCYWGLNADGSDSGNRRLMGVIAASGGSPDPGVLDADVFSSEFELVPTTAAHLLQAITTGSAANGAYYGTDPVRAKAPYVSGSYFIEHSAAYSVSQANFVHTGYRIGKFNSYYLYAANYTTPFTKTNLQTLTLKFRTSWGRNLVN